MTLRKLVSAVILFIVNIGLTLQLDENYRPSVSAFLVEKPLDPSEQEVEAAEQDVADFFWTGSGDGSGPKNPQNTGTKYPNTVVRTATILATVFIDGNFDDFDPLCVVDCDRKGDESGIVESIDQIPPEDRRYWLLTVVAGLFSKGDFPILEAKLAKLYRIAFLRQQAKHLGIANGKNTTATVNQTPDEHVAARKKRSISEGSKILPTKTLNGSEEIRTRRFEINKHVYERQVLRMKRHRVPIKSEAAPTAPPINLKLPQPYEIIYRSDDKSKSKKLKAGKNLLQEVNVIIHDALHLNDERGAYDTNRLDPSIERNQTEIIYSVIVGGKAILATTAAEDMQLVTNDEVVKIMENDVVLKAEPYLKEPLATPLVPPLNESSTVTSYVNQNPLLIALTAIAIVLFILLLLTLTLYGRSKRRLAVESKRQSATQALVQKINVDDDINTIRSNSLEDVGVENLAFEKERDTRASVALQKKDPPVLNFPLPPPNRPSSGSSTTSDSSVYYPKRRYKFNSIQDLLDENDGRAEEIYSKLKSSASKATVINNVNSRKEQSKVHKHRHRRKYRADNRVGSLEQINTNAFQSDADDSLMHNEAFNPHVSQYNANKLMADKTFTVIESEQQQQQQHQQQPKKKGRRLSGAEAINQELLHQHGSRVASADTNSIGSFLSMASIRSFPKCSVPEPLSRVLEPVSVTHLDHSDADYDTIKNYRMIDSQKSLDLDDDDDDDDDDIDVEETERDAQCTQSDGADPGFVGPIVWEMHKKGLDISTNSLGSPLRDPHVTRNRFEGLLEGAMKLYGSSSYSNCHSLMNQQEDDQLGQMPGVIKSKEARGRSAATIRLTSRTSGLLSRTDFHPARPKTADQPDFQPQNPLPSVPAWVSGRGSGSLVRPLSAGIYHKPINGAQDNRQQVIDRSRAMSASPIIDAIQEELKRISTGK